MSDFTPQLPSNRPKVDLAEQERIIAEWKANGGKVKTLPSYTKKPKPASPTQAVQKPTPTRLQQAKTVITSIQSENGLSEKAFTNMFAKCNNKERVMSEVKQIIKNQFGFVLITVNKYDYNGNIKVMMGLR